MKTRRKRKTTRSQTWPETRATVELFDFVSLDIRKDTFKITGKVTDIGSKGMFLKTYDYVPLPAKANITIYFDPGAKPPIPEVKAQGKIIRRCSYGIGIRFTSIDLSDLQDSIVAKLNINSPDNDKTRYRLGPARAIKSSPNVYHLKDRKLAAERK